ncbi:transposase family protein [Streptomyces sp. NBC_00228]|uniref:transposase family protein n=1 Tax=Streptomyces sp. NBC_00228 TaxID=2903637 RepID=UPI003FA6BC71
MRPQGRRPPFAFVLSLAAWTVLAGAKSLAAIAGWAADAPVLARLGGPCREPDRGPVASAEATVRRVLQCIDGDALDTAVGSWLAGRERAAGQEEKDSDRRPCHPSTWTSRPCAVPAAPTAPRSICSLR